jgi:hypothetical protein
VTINQQGSVYNIVLSNFSTILWREQITVQWDNDDDDDDDDVRFVLDQHADDDDDVRFVLDQQADDDDDVRFVLDQQAVFVASPLSAQY